MSYLARSKLLWGRVSRAWSLFICEGAQHVLLSLLNWLSASLETGSLCGFLLLFRFWNDRNHFSARRCLFLAHSSYFLITQFRFYDPASFVSLTLKSLACLLFLRLYSSRAILFLWSRSWLCSTDYLSLRSYQFWLFSELRAWLIYSVYLSKRVLSSLEYWLFPSVIAFNCLIYALSSRS